MNHLYAKIAEAARRLGADRVSLFGSRARGDNRDRSDIDIAVFGMPKENRAALMELIDSLPTLLDFDIVFADADTNAELLKNIERDGVILMDKFAEKFTKLKSAVDRLDEALNEYGTTPSDVIRDGAIQRFEFCTELAWKTLREYLLDQGYTEVNSPKSVMRQAYADGVLFDEDAWVSLLNDRNNTSHIYDEVTASAIFSRIREKYADLFRSLIAKLETI